ncbi:MAG: hypothetical protein SFZ03_06110 [Candidatus Melainabacteria bacterium]|nr:hypothetical protein [Candidatus Melainabacteria bacterium]
MDGFGPFFSALTQSPFVLPANSGVSNQSFLLNQQTSGLIGGTIQRYGNPLDFAVGSLQQNPFGLNPDPRAQTVLEQALNNLVLNYGFQQQVDPTGSQRRRRRQQNETTV